MRDRLLLLTYLVSIHSVFSLHIDTAYDFDPDDVCLSQFHIDRYTTASSDSFRDAEYTKLIFPSAENEYAPHFKQDYCARSSKTSLPRSCFKIHSPQTTQYSEGYLSVEALEHEFSKKFYAVITAGARDPNYDAFFDYNLGLWVDSLHKYLQRIDSNADILTDYIGLKWHSPSPIDKTFYSLIIHSPASQKVYELMSFNEPDLSAYPNLRSTFTFKETNELRASFLTYNIDEGEFPWTREDEADIVPIKLSFGCSRIAEHLDFYVNVLEAELLYKEEHLVSTLDGHTLSYAFLKPKNDMMEIEYVQRPIGYTYGSFTTDLYKHLLVNTHNDRITSAVCGLDRWFDNHYGFDTLKWADDPVDYNYLVRALMSHVQLLCFSSFSKTKLVI